MRLGRTRYCSRRAPGHRLYGTLEISERHATLRDKPEFIPEIEKKGLLFTGASETEGAWRWPNCRAPVLHGLPVPPELKSARKGIEAPFRLVRAALGVLLSG